MLWAPKVLLFAVCCVVCCTVVLCVVCSAVVRCGVIHRVAMLLWRACVCASLRRRNQIAFSPAALYFQPSTPFFFMFTTTLIVSFFVLFFILYQLFSLSHSIHCRSQNCCTSCYRRKEVVQCRIWVICSFKPVVFLGKRCVLCADVEDEIEEKKREREERVIHWQESGR